MTALTTKRFIVRKYIMAKSAMDAIKKEKKHSVDDCWIDEEWMKNNWTPNKLGFKK